MDRLESMTVLLAVVDAGSLSAAARQLRVPLPTVSRKLSDLEIHLNARLLTRSTRGVALTDTGQSYISACRRIMEDIDEAERAAAGEYIEPRGELVITAPVVFGRLHILPVVTEFLTAYPDVSVRLAQGDRLANLADDHVDLALRIGKLPDSGLISTSLGSIRRIVCASPAYLAEHGTPRNPQELSAHYNISFEHLAPGDTWRFRSDGKEIVARVRPRLIVNTAEAAIDAAVAGAGLTCVLSYQVESALRAGSLSLVLRAFEPAAIPVSFLYLGQGRVPLKLRSFLDFASPRLRARLQQAEAALTHPLSRKRSTTRKRTRKK